MMAPTDAQRQPRLVEARQRWRLVIRRAAEAPPQTPAEWQAAWEEALAASGLPVSWTGSRHPKPRFMPALPLPSGMSADRELADVVIAKRLPRWVVREAIERVAPAGHTLVDCHDVWVGEPSLPWQVAATEYDVLLASPSPDEGRLGAAVAQIVSSDRLTRQRVRGDRRVEYDLRPFIFQLSLARAVGAAPEHGLVLRMRLRHDPEQGAGRADEVLRELSERVGTELRPSSIARTRVLLAGDIAGTADLAAVRQVAEWED